MSRQALVFAAALFLSIGLVACSQVSPHGFSPNRPVIPVSWFMPDQGRCASGDCQTGRGTMIWVSGTAYSGQFKEGKWDGEGLVAFGASDATLLAREISQRIQVAMRSNPLDAAARQTYERVLRYLDAKQEYGSHDVRGAGYFVSGSLRDGQILLKTIDGYAVAIERKNFKMSGLQVIRVQAPGLTQQVTFAEALPPLREAE